MTYKVEFSDYDNGELFERMLAALIPHGYSDSSWRNDACPSMGMVLENGGYSLQIHIDYADPEMRAYPMDDPEPHKIISIYMSNDGTDHEDFGQYADEAEAIKAAISAAEKRKAIIDADPLSFDSFLASQSTDENGNIKMKGCFINSTDQKWGAWPVYSLGIGSAYCENHDLTKLARILWAWWLTEADNGFDHEKTPMSRALTDEYIKSKFDAMDCGMSQCARKPFNSRLIPEGNTMAALDEFISDPSAPIPCPAEAMPSMESVDARLSLFCMRLKSHMAAKINHIRIPFSMRENLPSLAMGEWSGFSMEIDDTLSDAAVIECILRDADDVEYSAEISFSPEKRYEP